MFKIDELVEILVSRNESNFDRACDHAYQLALIKFGANDNGHLTNVKDFERATDTVEISFINYRCSGGMSGPVHFYTFSAWIKRQTNN